MPTLPKRSDIIIRDAYDKFADYRIISIPSSTDQTAPSTDKGKKKESRTCLIHGNIAGKKTEKKMRL